MPKFKIRLTRDASESVDVEVKAKNEDEAQEKALELADTKDLDWSMDDGNDHEPYISDTEEM